MPGAVLITQADAMQGLAALVHAERLQAMWLHWV